LDTYVFAFLEYNPQYLIIPNMEKTQESPEFVRLSQAAAMTLDLMGGSFYRDAKLYCINILLTYSQGCAANCSYCGLSAKRPGEYEEKSFIRVTWPTHSTEDIAQRIADRPDRVKRVCISMITRKKSVEDTVKVARMIREKSDVPISGLISPTITDNNELPLLKDAGIDKIGIAIDAATEELFDFHRGKGAQGPHKWDRYWSCFDAALEVFGKGNVGSHYVVGLGETEFDMISGIQKIRSMGGETHLFSFFPEPNSRLNSHPRPHVETYRRVQLARYLIDNDITTIDTMKFDDKGRLTSFGAETEKHIDTGLPFMTSGCVGTDGTVACNRPYANERPSDEPRNFPFQPTKEEIEAIKKELTTYP